MTLLDVHITSVKFQLKLMSTKFLLPMISCNELYIYNTIYSMHVKTASTQIILSPETV